MKLYRDAFEDMRLDGCDLLVLCYLTEREGKDGYAFPSLETIGKMCRTGRRQAFDSVQHLVKLGYVRSQRTGRSNRYYVNPDVPNTGTSGVPLGNIRSSHEEHQVFPWGTSEVPLGNATKTYVQSPSNGHPINEAVADLAEGMRDLGIIDGNGREVEKTPLEVLLATDAAILHLFRRPSTKSRWREQIQKIVEDYPIDGPAYLMRPEHKGKGTHGWGPIRDGFWHGKPRTPPPAPPKPKVKEWSPK